MLLLFGLLLLNLAISWWNARAAGYSWAEAQAAGGWAKVMAWCAMIMSICGFTQVYAVTLALIGGATGHLPQHYVELTFKLTYVVIILPVIGSGMCIWIDSLVTAWRERTFGNIAGAGWNTFAQIHNTWSAVELLPGFLGDLKEAFNSDDDEQAAPAAMVLLLVLIALLGGILSAVAIMRSAAKARAQQVLATK